MSYLSRLIADSSPASAGRRASSTPARLDVDVLRDVAVRPAVAIPPADSPMGSEPRPFAPRAEPTDKLARDRTPTAPIPIRRDAAFHAAPSPPRHEPEDPVRTGETGADPIAASALPATQSSSDLARDVVTVVDPERASPALEFAFGSADPIRHLPVEAATNGVAPVEWDETEVATRVIAPARDDRVVEPPPEPGQLAEAGARHGDALDLRREDVVTRRPELQEVSLSIGTIEVVVDAPSAPPAPFAQLPRVDAGRELRALDDPIMRLRRQYVTWPEGR